MQRSILVIVIEPDNLERMKTGDPATLEAISQGGMLQAPTFPQAFGVLVAYEQDDAELYRKAKGNPLEMLRWLERGRKFIKGVDGKENAFVINKNRYKSGSKKDDGQERPATR